MDDQQINFADLRNQYHDRGRAQQAVEILRAERAEPGKIDLVCLLRHHNEESVGHEETFLRDSFDFLLAYYSLLEIACLIHYTPSTFSGNFREETLWNLSQNSVKSYYEEKYPLLLPRLFRWRVEGRSSLSETDNNRDTHSFFLRFLGIVNRLREDKEIELFQWFLDSGWVGNYSLSDTLKVLHSPQRTMEALTKEPTKRTVLEQSVSGAQKFLTFCGELDELLQETQDFPLLQSAMWTYFSYWFDLISDRIDKGLRQILESFREWGVGDDSEVDLEKQKQQIDNKIMAFWESFEKNSAIGSVEGDVSKLRHAVAEQNLRVDKKAIREYLDESSDVLGRLLSVEYGKVLREAAENILSAGNLVAG